MSRIIILVGSPRKDGNTERLAETFARGAGELHEVQIISVAHVKVKPCIEPVM